MSNWTLKQALSDLISKFRPSDSEGSSSSSSAERAETREAAGRPEGGQASDAPLPLTYDEDAPISPLALMNENSPEAWLGQFLLKLEVPMATERGTIDGARRDANLIARLNATRGVAAEADPLRFLDESEASQLKSADWAAWWRAQGALLSYCYSTLALALLGSSECVGDLEKMYGQAGNMQVQKDSHYVVCYLLGKPWPSYQATAADFERLSSPARIDS